MFHNYKLGTFLIHKRVSSAGRNSSSRYQSERILHITERAHGCLQVAEVESVHTDKTEVHRVKARWAPRTASLKDTRNCRVRSGFWRKARLKNLQAILGRW